MKRKETDSLGSLNLPLFALYGIQTERAARNFPVSGLVIGQFPDLIRALAQVKKACAQANFRSGQISEEKAAIIARVCDELIAGQHHGQFTVDVFQGGAGTSTNMNMNEVIANRGLELMGLPCGDYAQLHPNDDVNRSQSTNDVYPTALRVALMQAVPLLIQSLQELAETFELKGVEFGDVQKLGRTELQDAVPMSLGAEFRAYGVTLREDVQRLNATIGLLSEINLGGTAIGTGIAAPAAYRAIVVDELQCISGLPLQQSADLMEASWDAGVFVHLSGVLKRVATKLSKIANDLRLLSSGPRGGFGEIRLPAVQPGSSLMPGKVNPVIAEMVNQVAFQIIGSDVTITFAAEAGQLQLNPFEPLIAYNLLQNVTLLRNVTRLFRERCIEGTEADPERCRKNLEASTANITELVPVIGYEQASTLAKDMLSDGKTWADVSASLRSVIKT